MIKNSIWSEIAVTNELEPEDLNSLASWALRVYFGPNQKGKSWYQDNVTPETVLEHFLSPTSPISPEAMVEVWKAIPSLRAALERLDHHQLDAVTQYLQRGTEPSSRYTQGDSTLKEMAIDLGGITGTMVNKLANSAIDKLQRLTGGMSLADMEPEDLNSMFDLIEYSRLVAANEYAATLRSFKGNIPAFIENQVKNLNLTENEAKVVTQTEQDGLAILAEMEHDRIIVILLEDLNSYDNLFLGFQNAASKKIFPRRSGRPKGSKKKISNPDICSEELTED
jgi:hypothetical protein